MTASLPALSTSARSRRLAVMLAGVAMVASAAPSWGQSGDVVVMRKALGAMSGATGGASPTTPPGTPTPSPAPKPGDPDYYSWTVTDWVQSGACGSRGTETRDVACRNTLGRTAPDSACAGNGSGPRPIISRSTIVTATCGYAWSAPDWPTSQGACGSVDQSRDVVCLRSDGTPSDRCAAGSKPLATRTVQDLSGCGYAWSPSAWSTPSTTCGSATQTRTIACLRTDGQTAADDRCTGPRPDETQTTMQTSGCATSWDAGAWSEPAACGAVTQSRSVVCRRSGGQTAPDSECVQPKPADTRDATDYSTCPASSYSWRTGEFGSPTSTCGMATLTRQVDCTFSDGAVVTEAKCTTPRPSATVERKVISGCGYAWQADAQYGAPAAACGATVRSRAVRCMRGDGEAVEDMRCDAQTRPDDTIPAVDYSACGFGWTASAWSAPSSSCGSATSTRTVACQRSDGTPAADAQCSGSTRPETSETSYQTSGCEVSWRTGDYQPPAPACGPSPQTRSVTCLRSDGQTVPDGECAIVGAKPDSTVMGADYSTCTFYWSLGGFSAPTTTCGTSVQTRSVRCARSDITYADDSSCASLGPKPASTETTTQTSGCTYDWRAGPWGSAAPACGTSVHSRTVTCTRSDGTAADASQCTAARPASSEPVADYSTCSYAWQVSQWKGSSGVCGDSVIQTRSVTCQRSEGTTVVDAACGAARPASSQTISDYSGCSYSWQTTSSAWSSTCSTSATRTNVSTCRRSDGESVDDSFCTATKPEASETKPIYTSCTYAPTYSATYGTCAPVTPGSTAGTQAAPLTKCLRSDGTDVIDANEADGYRYCAATKSQSCTITYTPTYSTTYGTCVDGTQSAPIVTCTQSGSGASVSLSYCTPQTVPRSCTSPASSFANGNFEGSTGWTFGGSAAYGTVSGSRGAVLKPYLSPGGGTTASASQTFSTTAGRKYTIAYEATWMGGGGFYCTSSGAQVKDADGTSLASDLASLCSGTRKTSVSFVARSGTTTLGLIANGSGSGYNTMTGFDNVTLVAN